MGRKKYFYFASPHSFKYPLFVYLIFEEENGLIVHRRDHSQWIEVKNYSYYGEPVNCIIPAQHMEYDFVFSMLNSENSDNIFGAINYLLHNYRKKFIVDMKMGVLSDVADNIISKYFGDLT